MGSVVPEGDAIRKAIKWISEHLKENPAKSVQTLVNEATLTFNLSPKDSEFLIKFYRENKV